MSRNALFHGTNADVGTQVKPRSQTGAEPNYTMRSSGRDVAYATGSEQSAWEFADHAAGTWAAHYGEGGGRPHVYEVESHPEQRPGLYNPAHPTWNRRVRQHGHYENHEEVVAPGFKVKSRIDIKPGHQGTFPLNWRQFSTNPRNDVNHPDEGDIEHGHPGSTTHKAHIESFMSGLFGDEPATHKHEELPGQGRLF